MTGKTHRPRVVWTDPRGQTHLFGTARSYAPDAISKALADAHSYLQRCYGERYNAIAASVRIEEKTS